MKIYKAKSLIQGARVKAEFGGMHLVAIPDKYKYQDIIVEFGGKQMTLKNFSKNALTFRAQENKFGGGSFLLAYYEWLPDGEQRAPKFKMPTQEEIDALPPLEPEKVAPFSIGKEPNVLILCPKCGSGMHQSKYHNEFDEELVIVIQCVKCGHKL